jgi:hypothetical protein
MFTQEVPNQYDKLDAAIDSLLDSIADVSGDSDEYAKMVDQLVKLYKAKELDSKIKVSEFEAIGKQNNLDAQVQLKQDEINDKKEEFEATSALKKVEVEGNLKLKDLELGLKKQEHDVTAPLKVAETEAKIAETQDRRRVKPDTVALVAANLAGIIMIIGHERLNVIASKAIGFVGKLK